MNATEGTLKVSSDTLKSLVQAQGENATLSRLRSEAWKLFEILPMPSKEDEAWRRTDISRLDLGKFHLKSAALTVEKNDAVDGKLRIKDGKVSEGLAPEAIAQGVILMDLARAAREHAPLVEKFLGQVVPARNGKFESLNMALWNTGVFLFVPRNVEVAVPLHGIYDYSLADGEAVLPRTLIILEEGARATYFDEYSSSGNGDAFSCAAVEIVLGANAQLQYVNLQRWGSGVQHFVTQNADLGQDAKLNTLAVALGGKLTKANLGSRLAGQGASSRLDGLVFGDDHQQFTHHTLQEHIVPHTSSDLLFKAAVKDNARSIYTGMIRIDKKAQQTSAFQTSRNLLLSETARAHTIPMLEILADDVKCGHGASVGSLDADQRFYLMTRGLDRENADHIIVEGFFDEVLQRIPTENVREALQTAINGKLGTLS